MDNPDSGQQTANDPELVALLQETAHQIAYYGSIRPYDAARLVAMLQDRILDTSIESLECSVRTYNVFRRENFRTLREIAQFSESDLLKLRNFGRACLDEVKQILAPYGIRLADKPRRLIRRING